MSPISKLLSRTSRLVGALCLAITAYHIFISILVFLTPDFFRDHLERMTAKHLGDSGPLPDISRCGAAAEVLRVLLKVLVGGFLWPYVCGWQVDYEVEKRLSAKDEEIRALRAMLEVEQRARGVEEENMALRGMLDWQAVHADNFAGEGVAAMGAYSRQGWPS